MLRVFVLMVFGRSSTSIPVYVLTAHRLSDGGLLDGSPRPRRYKYQLLDPKDAPYAAFRFFCRSAGKPIKCQWGRLC